MRVEFMLYIYGAVCCSMIGFNILYNMMQKSWEPRMKRECEKLSSAVQEQFACIMSGSRVEEAHIAKLRRKLRHTRWLLAFDRVMQQISSEENRETCRIYLIQMQPVFSDLAMYYLGRDTMQAGYFSWFLSRYAAKRKMADDGIRDILLEYMKRENLYCRINALEALYAYGDSEYVIAALRLQDDGTVFIHEKILTEGLLSFAGSHAVLIEKLWQNLEQFSVRTQLAVLNYIRFHGSGYHEEMFRIMTGSEIHKELRLSAIRYFGKYPYEPALQILIDFSKDRDSSVWEYAAVSLSALASYETPEVRETFLECLHSSNWYIRAAAAKGLEVQGADYNDLLEIVAGSDRYAREMMMYRLESRRMREGEYPK